MNDKDFINEFKKISIKQICEKEKINYYNIIGGRAGYNSTKKVVEILQKKLSNLLKQKQNSNFIKFDD